jgi:hypothetical protein
VLAKTSKAAARLSESFRNRDVRKHYVCVVNGHLKEKQGKLHDFLVKSSKAKVKILPSGHPPVGHQEPGPGTGALDARLQYRVMLQVTRSSGRHREQSLLHIQLETGDDVSAAATAYDHAVTGSGHYDAGDAHAALLCSCFQGASTRSGPSWPPWGTLWSVIASE